LRSRLIALILGVLVGTLAHAEVKTVTWANATQNTDGTAIPASGTGSLVRTIVEYGTRDAQGGFGTKQGEMSVAAPATTLNLNLVVIQEYALRAFHCNTHAGTTFVLDGVGCSASSNVALTTVQPPKPAPPSSLSAVSTVAWMIRQTRDRVALLPVGTVPLGTACDMTQTVMGLYVVPKASLVRSPGVTVDPEVVLALCG
jgi:hypothetical protein